MKQSLENKKFRNIGPISAQWLLEIGIDNLDKLKETGSVQAYLQIRKNHPEANKALLWALIGSLLNLDWRDIPTEIKEKALLAINEKE